MCLCQEQFLWLETCYKWSTVIGPLLFVLYITDMPSFVSSLLYNFVNDTKLYRASYFWPLRCSTFAK